MTISYHEPISELSLETREIHRALTTLVEELEAVDWYQQRLDVSRDEELKAILLHNRDEEIEHAAMALEWLRRKIPAFHDELQAYLFTSDSITEIEDAGAAEADQPSAKEIGDKDLGVGKP
ncbi:MAG: hypothetical protein JXM70_18970 [Pirellulales bacterium]|nr:hypothetical protein [Pirellulales bacterium]